MSDPSDLTPAARSEERVPFDRDAHPALGSFFAALDDLAAPPADASVRLGHISRAAATAAATPTVAASESMWRTVGWRVAAVAAASAVVIGGLGADDRLPAPAQRMVSSLADALGVEMPDGSERSGQADDDSSDGQGGTSPGRSGDSGPGDGPGVRGGQAPDTPRATPADPGEPGEPATPAVPADPEKPDKPEQPEPHQPERPEQPEQPEPTPSSTPAETAPSTVPEQPSDPPGQSDAPPPSNPNAGETGADQGGSQPADADRGKKSEKSPAEP